jgi:hypothetical protein
MTANQITEKPHGKIYTLFCKCGWNMGIGDDCQKVDDFLFLLNGVAKQSCPTCGAKKLLIKNAERAA